MDTYDRLFELATEVIRGATEDARERVRRRRRRRRRAFRRFLKISAALALATVAIIVTMIVTHNFLGSTGAEGWWQTPLALIVAWTAILYMARKRPSSARKIVQSDLAQLPTQTDEWLDQQRRFLPNPAQRALDNISVQLEMLSPQLRALDPQTPAAAEVRRLLAEDLPQLVNGYQKVPPALKRESRDGLPSPERQLVAGLSTIEQEIGRVHERLAADDVRALAAHQRYLELKYKNDDKIE